ncbi:serine threonine kinase [Cladorrhinum samala]|uniref:Serine threonine kinase n=1 Tax=Cladorrhinum samala TaxID=585594 RepID=A0AAV9HYD7_9PEZI|nr:serine threonine kinase [Cladorrhinum samala]
MTALFRPLRNGTVTSALDDSSTFIPLKVLDDTITVPSITDSLGLQQWFRAKYWSDQLPRRIHQEAQRLFAILVLIEKDAAIQELLSNGLTDKELPLARKGNTDVLVSVVTQKEFACFESWSPARVDAFVEKQWLVQAPVIERVGQNLVVDANCPLPFIEKGEKIGGGNGVWVHQAHIHPAHRSDALATVCDGPVAIKEIQDRETFVQERDNLENLSKLSHRNLIKPLCTIERGSLFYVIFPWADGGDLRQFWEHQDSAPNNPELIMWSLEQALGVADAVKALHDSNIRHGDIKPQNVLHFHDQGDSKSKPLGKLVLADVGISRKHTLATNFRHWATQTKASTISYEAPEAEYDRQNDIPRSRKYDQWSLGCMFLEFTVWLLYGFQAVEVFRLRRTSSRDPTTAPGNFFTQKSYGSPSIHSRVSVAITHLRDDPRCGRNTALGELVTLVEDRLLQVSASDRADADELHCILQSIVERARKNPEFLCKNTGSIPAVPKFFVRRRRSSASSSSSVWSSGETRRSRGSFSSTASSGRSSNSSVFIQPNYKEEAVIEESAESS